MENESSIKGAEKRDLAISFDCQPQRCDPTPSPVIQCQLKKVHQHQPCPPFIRTPPKEVDLGANMSGNWAFFKSVKDVCIDWMEPIKKEPFKISERSRRTDSNLTNGF